MRVLVFLALGIRADGSFVIQYGGNNRKCLDLPGGNTNNGNMLQLWDCNGHDNQNWEFDAGSWQIKSARDNRKCVDLAGGAFKDGGRLQIWDCNGHNNQFWGYDGNMHTIYLRDSMALNVSSEFPSSGNLSRPLASKCMDLPGGNTNNGNGIEIWGCNGYTNQKWYIATPGPAPGPSPGPAPSPGKCDSAQQPKDTRCSGCPPMKDGKLCASTTHYNDQTKGSCGCGNSDPVPRTWWTKTQFTAALNAKNLDPSSPSTAWCPSQCGECFRLCSTGGTTQGTSTQEGVCHVFKIDNRCGDGFDPPRQDYWCSQEMTFQECQQDSNRCRQRGNTNMYGYSAHFDLQDLNGQIAALGWNNPEVTFEQVSCSQWSGPGWDCQCHGVGGQASPANTSSWSEPEVELVV